MLERVVENDPKKGEADAFQPFTLLGILLSVIGTTAGTIVAIHKVFSG